MTASFTDLIDYLTLTGWRRDSSGQSGSVWRREGWDKPLPVLDDLSREDYEWTSTVERIASICCGVSIEVFFSGVGSRVTSRTGFVGIASSRTANPQMSESTERAFRAADTPRSARRF